MTSCWASSSTGFVTELTPDSFLPPHDPSHSAFLILSFSPRVTIHFARRFHSQPSLIVTAHAHCSGHMCRILLPSERSRGSPVPPQTNPTMSLRTMTLTSPLVQRGLEPGFHATSAPSFNPPSRHHIPYFAIPFRAIPIVLYLSISLVSFGCFSSA